MQEHADPEEIADNLSEKQREILRQFEVEETRNTQDLTSGTEYTNHTVGYHAKNTLIKRDLLSDEGEDEFADTPIPPKKYQVTELGQRVIEVYRQREAKTEADISRVDELAQQVEKLEKENDKIRERLDDAEETIGKNKNAISYIKNKLNLG